MAEFLLDHNVSRAYVALLVRHGHDVRTARDEELDRADDGAIVLFAAEQGAVVITHNGGDFWLLHRAWHRWASAWRVSPSPRHGGILILPQRQHLEPVRLAQTVLELLQIQPDLTNSLFEWTVAQGWTRDEM